MQTDRQTGRQTDRQADRQTDRQAGTQIKNKKQWHMWNMKHVETVGQYLHTVLMNGRELNPQPQAEVIM